MSEILGPLTVWGLAVAVVLLLANVFRNRGASQQPPAQPTQPSNLDKTTELYALAGAVQPIYEGAAHPSVLIEQGAFLETVSYLCGPIWSAGELLDYATGDVPVLSVLALEALGRREGDEGVREALLDNLNLPVPWERYFALRALDLQTPPDEPVVGDVLLRLDPTWAEPHSSRSLRDFVELRRKRGESFSFGERLARIEEPRANLLDAILRSMPDDLAGSLRAELESFRARRIDREFLHGIGALWDGDPFVESDGPVLPHDALSTHVGTVESTLARTPRRSIVLVGEHGVGKTVIARAVASRLAGRGWVVFEAGHGELIAGLPYVGQVEERLRQLIERLRGRPVLWYVPNFHALAFAGRHQFGPLSALDFLLPYVERGDVVLLGETRPGPYEHVVQSKPRVATAFETVRVEPLGEPATSALIDRWAEAAGDGQEIVAPAVRGEALALAQQFLGDRSMPGGALQLLQLTAQRLRAGAGGRPPSMTTDDLIATLSRLTGLPSTILDDREGLDLDALRRQFDRRVLGQPEAIECLVERVAMIKAGTTDPTRPLGVFLFAGPTGTGKTEIAKTLAEFLFGSADRMIRLDMSEFQAPEALAKIVGGGPGEAKGGALVDRIRKQPFAVVLLDEFEKANPHVWDLFLQVFDDGRLSDHAGRTADFRNAIIVLTSNLGAVIPAGTGLGFSEETGRFHARAVLREVERSFRKEFLNRIDRVVVFRPFSRETMREILRKELADAFRRRGLRNRTWSVEWDEGAIELLLARGFTADLGARPLKRAVERYVLSPLSRTIVEHRVPEGDQFLFLRAEGDRLAVDFIDPDAPAGEELPPEAEEATPTWPSLATIALRPSGRPVEIDVLRSVHDRLRTLLADEPWQEAKGAAVARMAEDGFWRSTDRFAVLGRVEYVDRIEAGMRAAGSLLERLSGTGRRVRDRFPVDLVGRIASRLVLLDAASRGVLADEPSDAFVEIQAWSEGGEPSRHALAFSRRLVDMYRAWGAERGMDVATLEGGGRRSGGGVVLAVSGFASWRLLSGESGLHVLELPADEGGHVFRKAAVRVRVVPQPAEPPARGGDDGLLDQARESLGSAEETSPAIVRHYREAPSPLVRDAVRGWRTGHLDRVLAGDFDLRSVEADGA